MFWIKKPEIVAVCILLAIFVGAFLNALLLMNENTVDDFEHQISYHTDGLDSIPPGDPPITFLALAGVNKVLLPFDVSQKVSLMVGGALLFSFGAVTLYILTKRLTKSRAAAIAAAFFLVFSNASIILVSMAHWKQSFAISIIPISVLFFWRGVETKRITNFILSGLFLGLVGLTHEIAFGSLVIMYLSYPVFLFGYRKQIPWREIKGCLIIFMLAAPLAGGFYLSKISMIANVGGGGTSSYPPFFGPHYVTPISSYFTPALLALQ